MFYIVLPNGQSFLTDFICNILLICFISSIQWKKIYNQAIFLMSRVFFNQSTNYLGSFWGNKLISCSHAN